MGMGQMGEVIDTAFVETVLSLRYVGRQSRGI